MGQQYLIDSNAVIDYLSGKLPVLGMNFMHQIINDIPNLSVITKIEILGYRTKPDDQLILSSFVNDSTVIALQDNIVDYTIELRKEYKIKIPDAIIAATALCLGYTLISRNQKDFKNIPNLKLINPHGF